MQWYEKIAFNPILVWLNPLLFVTLTKKLNPFQSYFSLIKSYFRLWSRVHGQDNFQSYFSLIKSDTNENNSWLR